MGATWNDIQYTVRIWCRNPAFFLTAILLLTFGIGANTAIFSLINALLLRELPVHAPQQLVVLSNFNDLGRPSSLSSPMLWSLRKHRDLFVGVCGASYPPLTVEAAGNVAPTRVMTVSGDFFSVLGVSALLGRTLTLPDEEYESAAAVISYRYWQDLYGRDPAIIGKTLRIGLQPFTIVGVLIPEFRGVHVGTPPDLYIPYTAEPAAVPGGGTRTAGKRVWITYIIGRLAPSISLARAQAAIKVLWPTVLADAVPAHATSMEKRDFLHQRAKLDPAATGVSYWREKFSQSLYILMGVVGVVLLISCFNMASLLLARAAARQREIGIRVAMGASRTRLIRQLVTESVLLSTVGALLGVLCARLFDRALINLISVGNTVIEISLKPDPLVLGFTAAIALITAMLFGLVPAIRLARSGSAMGLRETAATVTTSQWTLSRVLVSSQVAFSLALLIAAGLLLRSLTNLRARSSDFPAQHLLVLQLLPMPGGYENVQLAPYYRDLLKQIEAIPGVQSATLSLATPLDNNEWKQVVSFKGAARADLRAESYRVAPGFFRAMGIPLLKGRDFNQRDPDGFPKVAIVSRSLAEHLFPAIKPLGHRIAVGNDPSFHDLEIVGVVQDAALLDLRKPGGDAVYINVFQNKTIGWPSLLVRTKSLPDQISGAVQAQIKRRGRELPLSVRTLAQQVDRSLAQERLLSTLSAIFAIAALLLACIGLYGLLSYSVARRTGEIGIRMALGATEQNIVWLVLRDSSVLVAIGGAIGLLLGFAAGRVLSSMLVGVAPADPLIFATSISALIAVGAVAGYLPARRAAKLDPMVALRND